MPFPATAKLLADNYGEDIGGSIDRVEMSDGNAKQGKGRRYDQRKISLRYLMTESEAAAFRAFHKDELFSGAFRFLWTDPVTGAEHQARIVEGKYRIVPKERFRACNFVSFEIEVFT